MILREGRFREACMRYAGVTVNERAPMNPSFSPFRLVRNHGVERLEDVVSQCSGDVGPRTWTEIRQAPKMQDLAKGKLLSWVLAWRICR